jgi:hypothetical protein
LYGWKTQQCLEFADWGVLGLTSTAELNDFLLLGVTELIGLLIVLLVGVLGTDELVGVLETDDLVGVLGIDELVGVLGTDLLVRVLGTDKLEVFDLPSGPAVSMLTQLSGMLRRTESDIVVSRTSHM